MLLLLLVKKEILGPPTEDGCKMSFFIHNLYIKFRILVLAGVLLIGNYYCYDIPEYLQNEIQERFDIDDV